jgi:hypothetical protein
MATNRNNASDRSAGGMDYDDPIRERAHSLGSSIAQNGPDALFEELDKMLPDAWREQISNFPIVALVVGFGVGMFLGMRKGDEVIAAGTSMVTAAAMSNLTSVLDRAEGRA